MRIIVTVLITLTLFLVLMLPQACTEQLELSVDTIPSEIDTNVPKISGKVSDPNATIYVNDIKAIVFENGEFFAYVEIQPRVPTTIEVRAESAKQNITKSFVTTFYPGPFLWVSLVDTNPDPARMEGWVSYPDAQIEIAGNLKDPAVEIQEDGFFTATFTLSDGYTQAGDDRTRYDIKVNATTSAGKAGNMSFSGMTVNSSQRPFPLNDVRPQTTIVNAERGKTALLEMGFININVRSPTVINLEVTTDLTKSDPSEGLGVTIEPTSFLRYPGAGFYATLIITVRDEVPSGSYYYKFNKGNFIEVIVE
jgi:hypothetical protein